MTSDATRATKLAVAQVERADELMAQFARRSEETLDIAQRVLVEPARRGLALIEGLRAMFSSIRARPESRSDDVKSTEEDDALFIG